VIFLTIAQTQLSRVPPRCPRSKGDRLDVGPDWKTGALHVEEVSVSEGTKRELKLNLVFPELRKWDVVGNEMARAARKALLRR
jgi:hypothetical protein